MLEGIRVLDLADQSGAHCGRILGDLGADVIRVAAERRASASGRERLVDGDSVWSAALGANKRLVAADDAEIDALAARADVVIQTRSRLSYAELARRAERTILVTITPYGATGPLASVPASDLEITAASGSLWLAGEPGRTPVRTTLPQSPFWTGTYAAVGALLALAARARTGAGQHVDVSAQAAMATVHPPAIVFWETLREEHRRLGPFLIGRSIVGAKFRNIWPCRDGYVSFAIQGGPIGRHTGRMLAGWMRERGMSADIIEAT